MKTRTVDLPGNSSSGLGAIQLLIMLFVLAVLGFAGYQAFKTRGSVARDYQAFSQQDMFGITTKQVQNFYDCLDKTGDFIPGSPQTCRYQDKTFERPARYDDSNIRNFERLPESSKATVRVIARKNFDICGTVPDTLSVTKVLNVVGNHVYLATGCDGGYAAILERQGLAWREINIGQTGLSCDTARQHKIPRALVYNEQVEASGDCFLPNGRTQALPEQW